jgi:transcriptional regulator with XRE-family HTH domain
VTPESLREWRDEHGWSQKELGEALGVDPMSISRWETGTMEIRHPLMLRLALERLAHTTPKRGAET